MGNEKSGLKGGGGGVARLTVCEVPVWDSGQPALPMRSPQVVLVFAKSAQDAGGMYRRGRKGGSGGEEDEEEDI